LRDYISRSCWKICEPDCWNNWSLHFLLLKRPKLCDQPWNISYY